jgi:hypothetical protein
MRERFDSSSHNPWTAYQGKTCPGDARVAQYPTVVARVAAITAPPTEDDSAGRGSDILPWTPAQLDALVALADWCCDTHDIPRRRASSARLPGAAGIAYHSQPMRERFDSSSHNPWTAYQGKTCPGDARVAQYPTVVARVAAITAPPTEDDVPYLDWPEKDRKALIADLRKALLYDITGSKPTDPDKGPWTNLGDVINAIKSS